MRCYIYLQNHHSEIRSHTYPPRNQKRYNVLRTIFYNQPIGRRMLASELNLGERVVRNEIDLLKSQNLIEINTPGMTVTKDGQYVKSFPSAAEGAIWCFETGKSASITSGVRGHIAEVANGKRKSAYGYIWKWEHS